MNRVPGNGFKLGLVLVVALSLGLSACAGEKPTTTTTTSSPTTTVSTTTTTVPETTTTAAPQDPITLKLATTFQQTEPGGKIVQHFCDYVEEETAGVVAFDVYFGGDLGNSQEELEMVSSEQVDIITFDPLQNAAKVPLLCFPASVPPDAKTVLDYFGRLVFDNQDTAPLIRAEATKNNIVYLGFTSAGGNVLISKPPFTALTDLAGKKFGTSGSDGAFKALGLDVVQSSAADAYKNLSSGTIEATDMTLAQAIAFKCYEVAKNFIWDSTYSAGSIITVNLRTWQQLTADTQQIMRDAAKDTAQFSLDLDTEYTQTELKTLAGAGVPVGTLSPEDQAAWWKNLFNAGAADCMTRAEKLGVADNMATVLEAAASYTGLTWTR